MPKSNIASETLDLRALRLLVALVDLRSLTRAGESVGLSQPAASRCLARLRLAVGDALLVRTSKGYAPTPRAVAAAADARIAVEAAATAFRGAKFDPQQTRAEVIVATTDYGAAVVLGPLAARLTSQAPGLRLKAIPWSESTLDAMEGGRTDLALATIASPGRDRVHHVDDVFAADDGEDLDHPPVLSLSG